MLNRQLFTQPKKYLSPILILSSALFVQLIFIIVMVVTVDRSEEKVRLNLQRQVRLERLQGDILHLDEVLTMSARMAAVPVGICSGKNGIVSMSQNWIERSWKPSIYCPVRALRGWKKQTSQTPSW